MRKLITSDLFAAMRVVRAAGVRDDIKSIAARAKKKDADTTSIGMDIVFAVMEGLSEPKAENYLYDFLAPIAELPVEELKALPLPELIDILQQIAADNDLKDFFRQLFGTSGKI